MDDTLAAWLQLREPADAAARSSRITRVLEDAVGGRESLRVLDLGTGTGANVRYLVPHLPPRQEWLTADRDRSVLAAMQARMSMWAYAHRLDVEPAESGCTIRGEGTSCAIETRVVDLGSLDTSLFQGRQLVTASALLDLVSERWLQTLAERCRDAGAIALFALTYNGWSACTPAEPEDELVRDLLNRHQRTDKGLGGIAAGPDAAEAAVRCFAGAGYHVDAERSDWALDASENELQRQLVLGWAGAALELEPSARDTIAGWQTRRCEHIARGRSHIDVAHVDLVALPPR